MRVLVVNTGSSSTKLRLVEPDGSVSWRSDLPALDPGDAGGDESLVGALAQAPALDAVAHRVVHGGQRFLGPVALDDEVERAIAELSDLAPLHQGRSLAGIRAARRVLSRTPAVACFDTAFHATMPPVAATYAVPRSWRDELGVRRYGFHGLSHAYVARRAAAMVGDGGARRLVSCHLGAGCSLAAVADGRSVDTTMGFTPLEGLVMATRSGSLDPGLIPWLVEHAGLALGEVADVLENRSGLAGLAGDADMAEVCRRARRGDAAATLAMGVYLHRLRAAVAAMAASLGGLDTLVFTGGVGEHSPAVRTGAVDGLGFLGVELDEAANARAVADTEIGAVGTSVRVLVVEAREDLEMAAEARAVLS